MSRSIWMDGWMDGRMAGRAGLDGQIIIPTTRANQPFPSAGPASVQSSPGRTAGGRRRRRRMAH